MIHGKCPTCGKAFETPSLDEHPAFPFCTDRCRLVDLGRWLDGDYAIPGDAGAPEPDPGPAGDHDSD